MTSRYQAAKILTQVFQGRSLAHVLLPQLQKIKTARDQSLVQAICFGVCRYYFELNAILEIMLEKPLNDKDLDIKSLLCIGLYQLLYMRISSYAAVSETVNATKSFRKTWAKPLINGILRNFIRNKEKILKRIEKNPEGLYLHPSWWINYLKETQPLHWKKILQGANEVPPLTLRINQRETDRADYLSALTQAGIPAKPLSDVDVGIILDKPQDVEDLPGFQAGQISVQDGAAQLACELLTLKPGLSFLDACTAPGGKLAHVLEAHTDLGEVVAIEKDFARLSLTRTNLERLKLLEAKIAFYRADAGALDTIIHDSFDRILLDAPCSASGVVRRHPDIKLLRRFEDLENLAKEQLRLLNHLWLLLKPDGLLLYATCSIFPKENEEVIQTFLQQHADACEEKIIADWGVPCFIGREILPGMHNMDGFYYARLRKVPQK